MTVPLGGCRRDDDRLRIDHLAHHPTGGVRGCHQHRGQAELLRSYLLKTAKQDVGGCIRARQSHTPPAQHGAEERIDPSGLREGKSSAEHTSELQYLLRNPYAVFCWKEIKKRKEHVATQNNTTHGALTY